MRHLHLAACVFGVAASAAIAAPVTCPDPKAVELNATADGWKAYTPPNAYDKPALKFNNMRVNPNNLWCQYEVGGGTVRLLTVSPCKPLSGTWDEKGPAHVCLGPEPKACVAECPDLKR